MAFIGKKPEDLIRGNGKTFYLRVMVLQKYDLNKNKSNFVDKWVW